MATLFIARRLLRPLREDDAPAMFKVQTQDVREAQA